MANKKFTEMTSEQRRIYVQKQKEKAWKTYEHWKSWSIKLNTPGNWTKADEDLLDTLLEKENG